MSSPLRLNVWRNIEGVRTPWIIELDASRNIIADRVDGDALVAVLKNTVVAVDPASLKKAEKLALWFDPAEPNPIPGTDTIRKAALDKIASASSENCTTCELNGIKTEFRELLEKAHLV